MRKLASLMATVGVFFTLTALGQGKPVVAVGKLEISAQNISCQGWDRSRYNCNQDLAHGFRAMLETAIAKTGKMDVMERGALDQLLTEQGLTEVGLTTSGGSFGNLTGVDYYVYGTITRFGAKQSGFSLSDGQQGGRGGSLISRNRVETEMGVDLKVTDVETGHIVIADSVSSTVKQGGGFSVAGFSKAKDSGDPFADVQSAVAAKIAEAIVTSRIPIKVIQIQDDGTLIVNYGNVFFSGGEQLAAFKVGESFVDPDTGEVLGAEETHVGTIQVTRVEPRFSRAKTISGEVGVGVALKRIATAPENGKKRKKRSGTRW